MSFMKEKIKMENNNIYEQTIDTIPINNHNEFILIDNKTNENLKTKNNSTYKLIIDPAPQNGHSGLVLINSETNEVLKTKTFHLNPSHSHNGGLSNQRMHASHNYKRINAQNRKNSLETLYKLYNNNEYINIQNELKKLNYKDFDNITNYIDFSEWSKYPLFNCDNNHLIFNKIKEINNNENIQTVCDQLKQLVTNNVTNNVTNIQNVAKNILNHIEAVLNRIVKNLPYHINEFTNKEVKKINKMTFLLTLAWMINHPGSLYYDFMKKEVDLFYKKLKIFKYDKNLSKNSKNNTSRFTREMILEYINNLKDKEITCISINENDISNIKNLIEKENDNVQQKRKCIAFNNDVLMLDGKENYDLKIKLMLYPLIKDFKIIAIINSVIEELKTYSVNNVKRKTLTFKEINKIEKQLPNIIELKNYLTNIGFIDSIKSFPLLSNKKSRQNYCKEFIDQYISIIENEKVFKEIINKSNIPLTIDEFLSLKSLYDYDENFVNGEKTKEFLKNIQPKIKNNYTKYGNLKDRLLDLIEHTTFLDVIERKCNKNYLDNSKKTFKSMRNINSQLFCQYVIDFYIDCIDTCELREDDIEIIIELPQKSKITSCLDNTCRKLFINNKINENYNNNILNLLNKYGINYPTPHDILIMKLIQYNNTNNSYTLMSGQTLSEKDFFEHLKNKKLTIEHIVPRSQCMKLGIDSESENNISVSFHHYNTNIKKDAKIKDLFLNRRYYSKDETSKKYCNKTELILSKVKDFISDNNDDDDEQWKNNNKQSAISELQKFFGTNTKEKNFTRMRQFAANLKIVFKIGFDKDITECYNDLASKVRHTILLNRSMFKDEKQIKIASDLLFISDEKMKIKTLITHSIDTLLIYLNKKYNINEKYEQIISNSNKIREYDELNKNKQYDEKISELSKQNSEIKNELHQLSSTLFDNYLNLYNTLLEEPIANFKIKSLKDKLNELTDKNIFKFECDKNETFQSITDEKFLKMILLPKELKSANYITKNNTNTEFNLNNYDLYQIVKGKKDEDIIKNTIIYLNMYYRNLKNTKKIDEHLNHINTLDITKFKLIKFNNEYFIIPEENLCEFYEEILKFKNKILEFKNKIKTNLIICINAYLSVKDSSYKYNNECINDYINKIKKEYKKEYEKDIIFKNYIKIYDDVENNNCVYKLNDIIKKSISEQVDIKNIFDSKYKDFNDNVEQLSTLFKNIIYLKNNYKIDIKEKFALDMLDEIYNKIIHYEKINEDDDTIILTGLKKLRKDKDIKLNHENIKKQINIKNEVNIEDIKNDLGLIWNYKLHERRKLIYILNKKYPEIFKCNKIHFVKSDKVNSLTLKYIETTYKKNTKVKIETTFHRMHKQIKNNSSIQINSMVFYDDKKWKVIKLKNKNIEIEEIKNKKIVNKECVNYELLVNSTVFYDDETWKVVKLIGNDEIEIENKKNKQTVNKKMLNINYKKMIQYYMMVWYGK